MNIITGISRQLVSADRRVIHSAELFGINFPLRLEPTIYGFADQLSSDYHGGYWHFYALSNGGFYMAPRADETCRVSCENGYEGDLSADALGISACLFAYSHLSFAGNNFGDVCARHYHWLREYGIGHAEAGGILAAID